MAQLVVWHLGFCLAYECAVQSLFGLFGHPQADETKPRIFVYAAFVLFIILSNTSPV